MELSNLSSTELRKLNDEVSAQIKARQHQELAKAREQILAIAQGIGLPLSELMSTKTATVKSPVAPQYRNPENAQQQWSGRGRRPQWVQYHLAAGKSLDAIKI
ncbi:DNA-binding protein H-NS [Oxalobacteraceae bacterium GrIS 1.11]